MTIDEARSLLPQYADGLLETEPARELEGLLAETPDLQSELKQLKEENALLEEALAPLRSSRSGRMRLSEAMVEVHRQATNVAESLPERGWRIFRLSYCFLALVGATLLVQFHPPSPEALALNGTFILADVCVYIIGLLFLVCGGAMASAEARLTSSFSIQKMRPSALGVLLVQVFGAVTILGAFGMYWWMLAVN